MLAATTLPAQPGAREGARKKMNIDISPVKLPDTTFWATGPHDPGLDPIPAKFKTSYFGIVIDGPKAVPIKERATLPVFAYYMGTYRETATRDFPHSAQVVSIDPVRNQIYVAPFVRQRGETILSPERAPEADLPEGYLMTFQSFDVRARVELPWSPGRVITQVILLDLASNRIETKLEGGVGAFVDAEKEKFLEEERAKSDPPAPFPAKQLSASAMHLKLPAIPEQMGVTLSAPRVAVVEGNKPLPLTGAWRLPVFPEELVKPARAEVNKTRGLMQPDGVTPYAACMTIHLVAVCSSEPTPFVYTLQIPVAEISKPNGQQVAKGTFSIDLRQLPQFPVTDQTVVLYAYAKEWASEAAVLGIIDRKQQ